MSLFSAAAACRKINKIKTQAQAYHIENCGNRLKRSINVKISEIVFMKRCDWTIVAFLNLNMEWLFTHDSRSFDVVVCQLCCLLCYVTLSLLVLFLLN